MKKETLRTWLVVLSVIVIIIGVRLTTQAGHGLDALQNDGYAGSGSFLIFIGGLAIGWVAGSSKKKK